MAVFRIEKTRDYTVMSNHHLRNTNLSLKAKGLLSLMLSLPENWDYTTKGLARICKDGVDSICAGVRELEEQGYVIRERVRNPNGQLGAIEYTILEQPRYLVFFKSRDADAITAAFQEFASRRMGREERPSIRERLNQAREQAERKAEHRTLDREKVKVKDRSVQR